MTQTDFRPATKRLSTLAALLPFFRPYRALTMLALFALFLTAGISLTIPLIIRHFIDDLNHSTPMHLTSSALWLGAGALLLAVGTAVRYYCVTWLGENVVADIRAQVFRCMLDRSPAFFETILTGEVISRITTDTTLVLSLVGSSVSIFLRNVIILLGGFLLMLWTSAQLTAWVLAFAPLVLLPILALGRKLRRLSRANQDIVADMTAQASESLMAVHTIQAFTHEHATRVGFADLTKRLLCSAQQRIAVRALMTWAIIFLIFIAIVVVLWIGARQVTQGELAWSILVQFIIYSIFVVGASAALSDTLGELQRAAGATERLVELLNLPDTMADPQHPQPMPNMRTATIRFENVTFAYPSRLHSKSLHNVNCVFKAGETVALVGASGAGKTTLFQLMLRFFDADQGRIVIEGTDIRSVARADLRQCFALVPQDAVIFAATAYDNIRFGNPQATQQDIETAARAAAAHAFICELPQGYNTYLGERGILLSGGQKQRIVLARAMVRCAPVLLLDEATSMLDSEHEHEIQQTIAHLAQRQTTVIIAHRLATVQQADRIVVLDGGRIVGQGRHIDLLRENALYARLAALQFQDQPRGV